MSQNIGIQVRHARSCPTGSDREARCPCRPGPSYRAEVFDRRSGKKIRKTFATITAAKAWRADALGDVRRGRLRAAEPITLNEAARRWLEGAEAGSIRTRSGDPYKPSALRGYRAALENRILPELGTVKLGDVQRLEVQELADRWLADGLDPSTIRNLLMPLRVIFRRALEDGVVAVNPCHRLRLAAVRGRRQRIASPAEAAALIDAVPEGDRALWATGSSTPTWRTRARPQDWPGDRRRDRVARRRSNSARVDDLSRHCEPTRAPARGFRP